MVLMISLQLSTLNLCHINVDGIDLFELSHKYIGNRSEYHIKKKRKSKKNKKKKK